jgi:hypothetical protein
LIESPYLIESVHHNFACLSSSSYAIQNRKIKVSDSKITKTKRDPSIPYGPSQLHWSEQVPQGAHPRPPSEDLIKVYPQVPDPDLKGDFPQIDYKWFDIPPTGLTDDSEMLPWPALCTLPL